MATSASPGRIDDVLNVSGHRMGTMEIESGAVAKTDLVAEAAVVGRPDDVTARPCVCGAQAPPHGRTGQIANELRNWVAKELAPLPSPRTSVLATTCPRPAAAKSCAACCAALPRARPSRRTPARWKTRNPGSTGPDQLPFHGSIFHEAPAKQALFYGLSDLRLFGPFIGRIAAFVGWGATLVWHRCQLRS